MKAAPQLISIHLLRLSFILQQDPETDYVLLNNMNVIQWMNNHTSIIMLNMQTNSKQLHQVWKATKPLL